MGTYTELSAGDDFAQLVNTLNTNSTRFAKFEHDRRVYSADFTVFSDDGSSSFPDLYACNASLVATLPDPSGHGNRQVTIKANGFAVTVRPTAGDTIDGATGDYAMSGRDSITIVADGSSNWEIIASV